MRTRTGAGPVADKLTENKPDLVRCVLARLSGCRHAIAQPIQRFSVSRRVFGRDSGRLAVLRGNCARWRKNRWSRNCRVGQSGPPLMTLASAKARPPSPTSNRLSSSAGPPETAFQWHNAASHEKPRSNGATPHPTSHDAAGMRRQPHPGRSALAAK